MSSIIIVICYYRKDVRLPVHLQRAMATEAEAQREARAQVSTWNLYFIAILSHQRQRFLGRLCKATSDRRSFQVRPSPPHSHSILLPATKQIS